MRYIFSTALGLLCVSYPFFVCAFQQDSIEPLADLNNEAFEFDKYSRMKNEPIIKTNFGNIKGEIDIFNNGEAMVFYGIRYAKPPVGRHRFRKTEPMDAMTNEIFGLQSNEKVACVQPKNFLIDDELKVSEDCLFLNIWVPLVKEYAENPINDKSRALPVMIWIHGGSFHMGSGNQNEFNGIALSTIGKLIVVTLNYRLGFFGFLYAGIESAPGNMGLHDQATALKWVKENIARFGGDPNQITVFGESAGGMSVALLTVSPLTKDLFNRAIIESGSPYSPVRPEPKAEVLKKSIAFSKTVNCSHPDAEEFTESSMKCLLSLDYQIIDDYGRHESWHSQILANPIFGEEFIPQNVYSLMKNSEKINKNLKVLVGVTRDEGFIFVVNHLRHLLDSSGQKTITKAEANEEITKLLMGRPVDPQKVIDFYFQNMTSEESSMNVFNTIATLYGDLYFNCPVYYLGKRYQEILGHENVYSYVMTEASRSYVMPICKDWSKVCHADEIELIFGVPLRFPEKFDESSQALSEHLLRLWTEFAKTGKLPWRTSLDDWFVELPFLADIPIFHAEMTVACETFWRELFQHQMEKVNVSE